MKVALIQQHYAHEATRANSVSMIQQAVQQGAQLVVLQELHQSHYFCQIEDTQNFSLSENFEGDVAFWQALSKELKIVLVTSLFEKRTHGLYHNTAVVFDCGSIAGKYRKMHIPDDPAFYEKFYFCEGDLGFEPIETSLGKLGVLVCWDQWYPEAARIMALKGAEILIYPTAIGWFNGDSEEEKARQRDAWITIQRAHSIANGAFTIAVNRVGFEADESGCSNGISFWGSSFISDPQGDILVQGSSDKEEVIVYEIDERRIKEVRDIWPFFRDRRIGSYGDILKRYCD